MGLKFRIVITFVELSLCVNAQKIGFGFSNFVGSGISNGLGLNLSYAKPLNNNALQFELEMRSIKWGNSRNLGIGFKATYKQFRRIRIGGITSGYFGVSPNQQNSFVAYGVGYLPYLQ